MEKTTKISINNPIEKKGILTLKEILKIKDNFFNLSSKKIKDIHKAINNIDKPKSYINMTTKGPSHKQIIVSMGSKNINKFIASSGNHITNLNYALKGIKSDIIIDFIHSDYQSLIIILNKVAFPFDLSIVENYTKNTNLIDSNNIQIA